MLKACRGVVLATGILGLPLLAQADCPPEDSIDRYAQTAGDALTALHGLVPESQQKALEDRYSAMIVLKWQWQGRDAIRADEKAMTQLLGCYQKATCGIRANDQITTQIVAKLEESNVEPVLLESLLPQQPSARTLAWAECILGRNAPTLPPVAPIRQTAPTQIADAGAAQPESNRTTTRPSDSQILPTPPPQPPNTGPIQPSTRARSAPVV